MRRTASGLAAALMCAGCSLFGPRTQMLTISSDPPGAKVLVNGEAAGDAPLQVRVQRGEDALIEVRKPGYQTGFRTTHQNLSTLGIIDVVAGSVILLPLLGLLSSAAWEHDPSTYAVILDPEGDASR
jgi:hypothetical protein